MSINDTKTVYSGMGMAIGREHGITLYGPIKAEFYENGRVAVEMDVEKQEINGTFVFSGTYGQFKELKIDTADGTVLSNDVTVTLKRLSIGVEPETLVAFFVKESVFLPKSGEGLIARYWKIYLTNCDSKFMTPRQDMDDHPLSSKNKWKICFKFRGRDVFVEAVDNYDERLNYIKEEKEACVTAIMVGDVLGNDDLNRYEDWLPMDAAFLLGLATGNSVGMAYIEFFDVNGVLIKRVHPRFLIKKFLNLENVIYEPWHRGTEELLTKAFLLEKENLKSVKVLINQYLAAIESNYLEDILAGLAQAIDGLMLDKKLIDDFSHEPKAAVLGLLDSLATYFDAQEKELKKTIEFTVVEKEALESFRRRVEELPHSKVGFSKQLAFLLQENGLFDCDALKDAKFNRKEGHKWLNIINYYRNKVIHGEVIDTNDFEFVEQLIKHLEDILLRLIFMKIGYEGKYQPRIASSIMMDKTAKWVSIKTQPKDFGYERWL